MRFRAFSISPVLALMLASGAGAASAQVTVSPIVSERPSETITIANSGASAIRLEASVGDFEQYGDGSHRILARGQSPNSCGARLHVGTVPTQVGPEREERIAVRVDPGAEACWSAILLRVTDGGGRGGTFIIKLYGLPAGALPEAEVAGLSVSPTEMRLEVHNRGNVPIRPRGRLEFRAMDGAVVAAQEIPAFGVHPGVQRVLRLPVSVALKPGRYVALAILDVGGADLLAGQTTVSVGEAERDR
jgi:hypothetical protein